MGGVRESVRETASSVYLYDESLGLLKERPVTTIEVKNTLHPN